MSAGEVMEEVQKDIGFYKYSGGGVTFSGGEPMLQAGFLKELLTESKNKGIHTAVDTAGHVAVGALRGNTPLHGSFPF